MFFKKSFCFCFFIYSSPVLGEVPGGRRGLSLVTPALIAAQTKLGFTGGGRSALDGGAHLVRFMGCALSFFNF